MIKFPELLAATPVPEALLVPVAVPCVLVVLVVPNDTLALFDDDDNREVSVMNVEGVEFEVDLVDELMGTLGEDVPGAVLWDCIDDVVGSGSDDDDRLDTDTNVLLVPNAEDMVDPEELETFPEVFSTVAKLLEL